MIVLADVDAATTTYQQVLPRSPNSATLRIAGADIAIANGDDQGAASAYAAALRLAASKSELALVRSRMCHTDILEHSFELAKADCSLAAALTPAPSSAYENLSAADLALGNPSAALADINEAIGAWVGGASVYGQANGVDGYGLSSLYSARAWIEIQLNGISAAINDFQHALQALPTAAPDTRGLLQADIATAKSDRV
jgi:hypothetical protein